MRIFCISASNIKHAGKNSTSLKVCNLIGELIKEQYLKDITVETIPLVEYELNPCLGCGKCYEYGRCAVDNQFNRIYNNLSAADAIFIVAAHYAPIPAKLSMLLEKIEQLAFLRRFHDEAYRSELYNKPVGIIAHGGGTEEICKYYNSLVLDTIANALSYPVEMKIVGVDEAQAKGVTIPVNAVRKEENNIFPIQEYNWNDIRERIMPLVSNVINQVLA